MNVFQKTHGVGFYLRKLVWLVLSVGLILLGIPVTAGAAGPVAKAKFFPGGPQGFPPDPIRVQATANDARGNPVPCKMRYRKVNNRNRAVGKVIKKLSADPCGANVTIGSVADVALVEEGQPDGQAFKLIPGAGGPPALTPARAVADDKGLSALALTGIILGGLGAAALLIDTSEEPDPVNGCPDFNTCCGGGGGGAGPVSCLILPNVGCTCPLPSKQMGVDGAGNLNCVCNP